MIRLFYSEREQRDGSFFTAAVLASGVVQVAGYLRDLGLEAPVPVRFYAWPAGEGREAPRIELAPGVVLHVHAMRHRGECWEAVDVEVAGERASVWLMSVPERISEAWERAARGRP